MILQKPFVILLDNVTYDFDHQTKKLIKFRLFEKFTSNTIICALRSVPPKYTYDQILELKDGTVNEHNEFATIVKGETELSNKMIEFQNSKNNIKSTNKIIELEKY